MNAKDTVFIEGVTLIRRHPTGWLTTDGSYELVERRRGAWDVFDLRRGRVLLATGGTRANAVKRLSNILDGSYKGPLPYVMG